MERVGLQGLFRSEGFRVGGCGQDSSCSAWSAQESNPADIMYIYICIQYRGSMELHFRAMHDLEVGA